MKRKSALWIVLMLTAAILAGCSSEAQAPETPDVQAPVVQQTTTPENSETTPPQTQEEQAAAEPEAEQPPQQEPAPAPEADADTAPQTVDSVYAEQIDRYYTALAEQWDEATCLENGLSASVSYYYEGDPLENVGFGFVDLDYDGSDELVIGAILNAEQDPAVFEIWTLRDGEPVMLAQGGPRNRFCLQYPEDDAVWFVANEASNGAANSATHYLMLRDGVFEVMQAIIFDAAADEQNPWFMAYDTDWDTSNDTPIDEELALAVMEAQRNTCVAFDYTPYSLYK